MNEKRLQELVDKYSIKESSSIEDAEDLYDFHEIWVELSRSLTDLEFDYGSDKDIKRYLDGVNKLSSILEKSLNSRFGGDMYRYMDQGGINTDFKSDGYY